MTTLLYCASCENKGIRTYHFNEDGPCPRCNAGAFYQCFHDDCDEFYDIPENHPDLLTAVRDMRIRNIKAVIKNQPFDVLEEALEMIQKEMRKYSKVTYIKIEDGELNG